MRPLNLAAFVVALLVLADSSPAQELGRDVVVERHDAAHPSHVVLPLVPLR